MLDFHPLVWSFDEAFHLKDPYFAKGHVFSDPVSDYVGASGGGLAPSGFVASEGDAGAAFVNPHQAHSYQHPVGDQLTAMIEAGLSITTRARVSLRQRVSRHSIAGGARGPAVHHARWGADLPLMLGVVATRP